MKVQNYPGIYVYYVDIGYLNKKLRWFYFDEWKSFFQYFGTSDSILNRFGDFDSIWRTIDQNEFNNFGYSFHNNYNYGFVFYCVCDESGHQFAREELTQRRREFVKERIKNSKKRIHQRRHGRKKKAWGRYHRIRTVRSNRNYFVDPDGQELQITIKQRMKANPPDSRDREKFSHSDKSWKTQSKRDHQWKSHNE